MRPKAPSALLLLAILLPAETPLPHCLKTPSGRQPQCTAVAESAGSTSALTLSPAAAAATVWTQLTAALWTQLRLRLLMELQKGCGPEKCAVLLLLLLEMLLSDCDAHSWLNKRTTLPPPLLLLLMSVLLLRVLVLRLARCHVQRLKLQALLSDVSAVLCVHSQAPVRPLLLRPPSAGAACCCQPVGVCMLSHPSQLPSSTDMLTDLRCKPKKTGP